MLRPFLLRFDDLVARVEAVLIGLLVLAMTGVTLAQVVARYGFGDPLIWSEEAARYLFVWVTMIGAALAMQQGGHYALDALGRHLPAPMRSVVRFAALLVTAGFLALLLGTGIVEARQAGMQFSATLPMEMDLPYLAIPVGAALMLLHLAVSLLRPSAP
ncbi:TRAP transporter small permease [Humitalea sp. 24SJ18S-53]|uniref:TRAP transporter small permease n=1 Tax=Humitalea sp. 24SJ18S-53 TaxID=3422307 RepID=UPI003D67D09C